MSGHYNVFFVDSVFLMMTFRSCNALTFGWIYFYVFLVRERQIMRENAREKASNKHLAQANKTNKKQKKKTDKQTCRWNYIVFNYE